VLARGHRFRRGRIGEWFEQRFDFVPELEEVLLTVGIGGRVVRDSPRGTSARQAFKKTTTGRSLGDGADPLPRLVVEAIMRSVDPPDLSDLLRRPAWHRHAACRGNGITDFFPPEGSSPVRAADICALCPVSAQCLEYALDNPSLKGVWAGTSERRRRRMRAATAAAEGSVALFTRDDPSESAAG
jgi:hypothetical protein